MANMSSIVEPASTGGINMTMDTSIIAAAAAVGAKRRKQTKVTQIQTVPHSPASVENTAGNAVTVVEKAIEMQKQQPDVDENCQRNSEKPDLPEGAPPLQSIDANNSASQDQQQMSSVKLPNPLPPGMPLPPISSTSVVEPTDQVYTCPLCHENQNSQKEFTTHIRGHNEVKPHNDPNDPTGQSKVYFCCLCGKMLSSFSSLDRHMLVHSGERPFSCELCGQTFTTNGNMHRHKRTHASRDAGAGTAGALDCSRSRVGRKRKPGSETEGGKKINNNTSALAGNSNGNGTPTPSAGAQVNGSCKSFKCPACPETFISELNLDHHMYEIHPGQEVVCKHCSFTCPNYNYLKLHKTMFHFSSTASTTGPGLMSAPTFTTTSPSPAMITAALQAQRPENFNGSPPPMMVIPHTAKPPGSLAPLLPLPHQIISAAAEAASRSIKHQQHQVNDTPHEPPTKAPLLPLLTPPDEEKNDLADVQSMLSMAKTGVDNIEKSQDSESENENDEKTLSSHEGICLVEDPIIRDMKLKGEFPCRLCPAVYPNLRALKGHNKEHLGKPPYICNVGSCNYSSNDKSTLTRHMRTHTGEKPFECKLCNYGFTTKANCERHLKNKHGKTSRDAIRTSIITHETECDLDGKQIMQNTSENGNSGAEDNMSMPNHEFRCKVCKQLFPTSGEVIAHAVKDHPAYSNDVDHIFEEVKGSKHPIMISRMLMDQDGAPSMVPRPATMIEQLKGGQVLNRKLVIDDTELEAEAPLDLSRPSRPSSETSKNPLGPPTPSIYSNMPQLKMHGKIPMMPTTNPTDLLSNNFGILPYILPGTGPNAGPPGVVQPIPTNNLLKTAGAPPGFPFPFPFPFLPNQINPQALAANFMSFMPNLESLPAELKEQMKQRLQNNSGPIVGGGGANPDLTSFMHQEFLRKQTELKEQKEAAEALQHLSKVQQAPPKSAQIASAAASPVSALSTGGAASVGSASTENKQVDNGNNGLKSDSDSNYKMVIKNGVLMKKQKQRRYRTERPYNCQFCEARFTLRSNMERHIKQQHPQHWCQKPRGSRRNHAATVPVIAPQFRSSNENEDSESENKLEIDDERCMEENQQNGNGSMMKDKNTREDSQISANCQNNEDMENSGDEGEEEEEEEGFEVGSDNGEDGSLIIDEPSTSSTGNGQEDLASVSKLLNSASAQSFQKYFDQDEDGGEMSSGSSPQENPRKQSAYSAAPHKIACPYCERKFPWTSSLKRHILTHTGHKPYKCAACSLWFTTKSNCDRHLIRKHGGANNNNDSNASLNSSIYAMRNVPDRPYKCKMCPSSSFSSQSNLRKHHLTKHLNMELGDEEGLYPEEGDDEFSMEESTSTDQDKTRFRCHICSIGFDVRAIALSHMRANHSEECVAIEALVNTRMEMELNSTGILIPNMQTPTLPTGPNDSSNNQSLHPTSSSKEGVECIFCPFVSKTFLELRRHVSKDHGVKYTCDICHKSFGLKKLLVRHKKKHDSGVSSASGDESELDIESASSLSGTAQAMASSVLAANLKNSAKSQQQSAQNTQLTPSNLKLTTQLNQIESPIVNNIIMMKKKPSLMDTINKLSASKQKSSLDNLFNKSATVQANQDQGDNNDNVQVV